MTAIWLVEPQLCARWCSQRRAQSGGLAPGLVQGPLPVSPLCLAHRHTCDEAVQKVRLRQSWYVTAGVGDARRCRFLVPLPHPQPPGTDRQEVPLPPRGPRRYLHQVDVLSAELVWGQVLPVDDPGVFEDLNCRQALLRVHVEHLGHDVLRGRVSGAGAGQE